MTTQVIHLKNAPAGWRTNPDYLYIGRPSYLGNPFVIGRDGMREEVIEKYQQYLSTLRAKDPQRFDAYMQECVQGRTLICYCSPLKCHGDVIIEWLEEQTP